MTIKTCFFRFISNINEISDNFLPVNQRYECTKYIKKNNEICCKKSLFQQKYQCSKKAVRYCFYLLFIFGFLQNLQVPGLFSKCRDGTTGSKSQLKPTLHPGFSKRNYFLNVQK